METAVKQPWVPETYSSHRAQTMATQCCFCPGQNRVTKEAKRDDRGNTVSTREENGTHVQGEAEVPRETYTIAVA